MFKDERASLNEIARLFYESFPPTTNNSCEGYHERERDRRVRKGSRVESVMTNQLIGPRKSLSRQEGRAEWSRDCRVEVESSRRHRPAIKALSHRGVDVTRR